MQHSKKWDKTGTVTKVLPDQQYHIRLDGSSSITLQSCWFIRPYPKVCDPAIIPSAVSDQIPSNYHNDHFVTQAVPCTINEHLTTNVPEAHNNAVPLPLAAIPSSSVTAWPIPSPAPAVSNFPQLLKQLAPHNTKICIQH